MGNASRVVAVVEALVGLSEQNHRKISCHIVTWGSAYRFLSEYKRESALAFDLIESHSYGSAEEVLDLFSPRSLFAFTKTFARNVFFLRKLVARLKPALIILDSDYHFPAYFGSGSPIIYIGQANDVLERAKRDSYKPSSMRERLNFNFKERFDSLLQSLFSNWILVPSFSGQSERGGKVKNIPLIVRKEFLGKPQASDANQSVGILLSGSELEKSAFLAIAKKFNLKVLSPGRKNEPSTVPSHAHTLDEFGIIFTQGGLSSISECIAREKFLVVFPMHCHPEQVLNAAEVENLGLGMRSSLEELNSFPELLREIVSRKKSANETRVGCNGAEVAARFIFSNLPESHGLHG